MEIINIMFLKSHKNLEVTTVKNKNISTSLCPVITLITRLFKVKHSSGYTLLLGGRATGNAVVLLYKESVKESYRLEKVFK